MAEDVCNDGGHAVLALEFRPLDALEALSIGLLAENFLLIGQHAFDEMENRTIDCLIIFSTPISITIPNTPCQNYNNYQCLEGPINIYSIRCYCIHREVMHYYPLFPLAPTYLHPAVNPHLHAELTAIRHGHLIREQAEFEYLSRTNQELASLERAAQYSNEVLENERRIARMLEDQRANLLLERQLIEERNLKEELRFKEQMRKLDIQRQLLLGREGKLYMTDRKKDTYNENLRQTLKDPMSEANKQTAKFNTVQNGGEIINFKPKDYYVPVPKNKQSPEKGVQSSNRRHKVRSVAQDITYHESDENNVESSNTKRRSSILKYSQSKQSPKLAKSKKQVKFVNQSQQKRSSRTQSFEEGKNESYCLKNSALRAAYTSNRKKPQIGASKMIENRLRVATVVYRDSQFRNIKHEMGHLTNTYDTECRLRKDLKGKINGRDDIIRKYNIVPPDPK